MKVTISDVARLAGVSTATVSHTINQTRYVSEETRERVAALVHCIDDEINIHDFRMVAGPSHTNVIFDAVVPYGFRLTDSEVEEKIKTAVRTLDGNYFAVVNVERSYT